MLPWSVSLAGRLDELVIDSVALRGNHLGDPHERPLWVYVPPGYDDDPERRYPSIYIIQGYTGHLSMWRNRSAYRQPFIETADSMFARGDARRRSSSTSTPGVPTAVRSSWTHRAPAATTPTCARTLWRTSTLGTARCPTPLTGGFRASRVGVSER